MQIAKINEKDLIDTIMLLREFDFGETDDNQINVDIITRLLSRDWGFWKTVTDNLSILANYLQKVPYLNAEDKRVVNERIVKIKKLMDETPKSLKWKIRSMIGEKVKWYQDVEELADRL